MPHWVIFHVPTPTPDGQTARDLYEKRVRWFSWEMMESARKHGCRFRCAFTAADGSAFWAIACWETREGGRAFYEQWDVEEEPGEVAIRLEGDVGLVPLG
jgi:hypothetical protein